MKATTTRPVSFDWPPRIGHHPGVMDGREYLWGWLHRKQNVPRCECECADQEAGWFDADTAIRLGRDIGQRSEG